MVTDSPIGANTLRAPASFGFFRILRAVRESDLTPTERLVLLVVASHADNTTGEAWPGIPRIAVESGFTTRTVERALASLAKRGWLRWQTAASKLGTNVYTVTPLLPAGSQARTATNPGDRVVHLREGRDPSQRCAAPLAPQASAADPDARSGDRPIPDRSNPDRGSGNLPISIHSTESEQTPTPADTTSTHSSSSTIDRSGEGLARVLLEVLSAQPVLRSIATPSMARRLADEARSCGRSEVAAKRALHELGEHAGDALAAGAPLPPAVLAGRARSYVRHVREHGPAVPQNRPVAARRRPVVCPVVPEAPEARLTALRSVLGALATA